MGVIDSVFVPGAGMAELEPPISSDQYDGAQSLDVCVRGLLQEMAPDACLDVVDEAAANTQRMVRSMDQEPVMPTERRRNIVENFLASRGFDRTLRWVEVPANIA